MAFTQQEMTLQRAIALGLENNFDIKIAAKNIEIADNNNTWARVGRYPTIDLNGSFTNTLTKDNLSFFLRDPYYAGGLGASLDANWLIYNGGRVRIAKDQLEHNADIENLNQQSTIHNTIKDIIQLYYTVLYQQERYGVVQESLQLSEERLRYEETKKEFGASNSFSLIQFENAIISDSIELLTQEVEVQVAKRNFYSSLDLIGDQYYVFQERLSIKPETIEEDKLRSIMAEENYTLKSLFMINELSLLNTKLEKTKNKPTITLNGKVGVSESLQKIFGENPNTGVDFDFAIGSTLNGSVNAFANWNLYDGGIRRADQQNAKLNQELSVLNILQATAQLQNQLDILISNYKNQMSLLVMSDKQLEIANRNIILTNERYKAGQITSLDYRTVQNQHLVSAFNKVSAIYNLLITKSEIDYLVGKFSE